MNTRKIAASLTLPIAAAMFLLGADAPLAALPPTTAPAPTGKPLTAVVVAVEGKFVQYRPAEDADWQTAKVNQVVDIGGEFRTGPHSSVKFKIPPDQVITLDRLGTIKLLKAIEFDKTHVAADMGMKYGRVHYDVAAGDQVEHQTTVRAPSATLSVSGTETFTFGDQRPGPAYCTGRNTSITFQPTGSPLFIRFGRKGDNANQGANEGDRGTADHRHKNRIDDPGKRNARSEAEFQVLGNYELYSGEDINSSGITAFHGQGNARTQVPTSQPSGGGCPCDH